MSDLWLYIKVLGIIGFYLLIAFIIIVVIPVLIITFIEEFFLKK